MASDDHDNKILDNADIARAQVASQPPFNAPGCSTAVGTGMATYPATSAPDETLKSMQAENKDDPEAMKRMEEKEAAAVMMKSSSSNATSEIEKPTASSKDKSKKDKKQKKKKKKDGEKDPESEKQQNPFGHLPEHEQEVLKRQVEAPPIQTSVKLLYRYATRNDIIILIVSSICAAAAGAVMPLMTIVFGNLAGNFGSFTYGGAALSSFTSTLNHNTLYFIYLGIGEFITVYIATVGFMYTGMHITQKVREQYLKAILRQNIGFFDKLGAGEITTRITADTNLIQDGISQKVALSITAFACFITAFVVSFIKYWKLTLIMMSILVAIVVSLGAGFGHLVKWEKKALDSYAVGGALAEEVLSSIRIATAFSTQEKLARKYDEFLAFAEKWGKKYKSFLGFVLGMMYFLIYINYALAFWQGSKYLVSGEGGVDVSTILTILLSMMIGAFQLGLFGPNMQAFTTAAAAAGKIFSTIDRQSPLDATNNQGETLDHVDGNVELKNIRHIYPSRPDVVVMDGVNLFVPAGKTTALVGASGCGKSTIVGLVERFYDPVGGDVFLDGVNVRDLNLQFLRRQMSLVSQEPTLFGTTIFGNIAHGLIGTKYETLSGEKQTEMVVEAAKMANAHDFIEELPEGYDTNVGDRGFLLSGGQKQRIAIARAVISDPKILLLDEATSALDTKSEGVVQAALDRAAQGRTTISIAHRLSTIKDADNIVVMSEGRIIEQGTHNELLEKKEAYFHLVEAQQISAKERQEQEAVEEEVERENLKHEISRVKTSDSRKQMYRTGTSGTEKSISSAALEKQEKTVKEDGSKYSLGTLIKLIAGFNKSEWMYMLIGAGFAIIAGSAEPVQAVFFAKSIVALTLPPSMYDELRSRIDFWAGLFVMLAGIQFISHIGYGASFAFCSEKLIRKVRDQSFRTMLRQDIGYFDKDENSSGALTSFLSTQATHVAGLSGETLGTIISVLTTLTASFALALAVGWKLALVCIATVPVLLGCGFLRFWILERFERSAKTAYEESANYACEATSAIRTVASLTREQDVWDHYHNKLVAQGKRSLRSIMKSSTLYAASQSLVLLIFALGFWYGGKLIGQGEYSIEAFFIAFSAVIFGAQSAGTVFSFSPDMGKAKHAAGVLKTLFDRQPIIDIWSQEGKKPESVEGAIEFQDVHFRYPSRPTQPVLRGLTFTVKPGQYIALVGPSGCGKSTTVGLLERFYPPLSGNITLDGIDISNYNLLKYRSHFALVSQEPTLYQGTIRDNILLGADGDESSVSQEQIEKVCRDANIYNFIMSLPDGFATEVGGKGLLLSGGQKQRIAIARALLRNPKILLLDEATSALDSESEKVVQAALDKASEGRTTIAIAHRLSTIQGADRIYVFERGVVIEEGTHEELLRLGGKYRELVSLQSLDST